MSVCLSVMSADGIRAVAIRAVAIEQDFGISRRQLADQVKVRNQGYDLGQAATRGPRARISSVMALSWRYRSIGFYPPATSSLYAPPRCLKLRAIVPDHVVIENQKPDAVLHYEDR